MSYAADGTGVNGTFGRFDSAATLQPNRLNRPDGAHPPEGEPGLGSTGVRTKSGRIITDAASALLLADTQFTAEASAAGGSVSAESRCYLGVHMLTRDGVKIQVSDGKIWCGPVLLTDSADTETWISASASGSAAETIVEATLGEPTIPKLTSTERLGAGVSTYRSDGAVPPGDTGQLRVPDADPVEPGDVRIVDVLPSAAGVPAPKLTQPDDGRLVTASLALHLTGLARGHSVGAGAEAVVAAAGEELVVAGFEITRPDDALSGNGTATLIVDGARVAVRDWNSVQKSGVLLASVPIGSRDVELEVLSQDRAQRISLDTGRRADGAPAVLYRNRTEIAPATPLIVTVRMPKGRPVVITGTVAQLQWRAWNPEQGWAPPGQAFLAVTVDDWKIDKPCCDVKGIETTTTWTVKKPVGTVVSDDNASSSSPNLSSPSLRTPSKERWNCRSS